MKLQPVFKGLFAACCIVAPVIATAAPTNFQINQPVELFSPTSNATAELQGTFMLDPVTGTFISSDLTVKDTIGSKFPTFTTPFGTNFDSKLHGVDVDLTSLNGSFELVLDLAANGLSLKGYNGGGIDQDTQLIGLSQQQLYGFALGTSIGSVSPVANPAPTVPEPASVGMLGSGAVGLIAIALFRRGAVRARAAKG